MNRPSHNKPGPRDSEVDPTLRIHVALTGDVTVEVTMVKRIGDKREMPTFPDVLKVMARIQAGECREVR